MRTAHQALANANPASTEPPTIYRDSLLDSPIALIENLQHGGRHTRSPEAWCPDFQICLPYAGIFVWHVGDDDVAGDPTQAVFVRGNEAYSISSPADSGYCELIITPNVDALSEIAYAPGSRLEDNRLFRQRSVRVDSEVQLLRARFLHTVKTHTVETLELEELVLALMRTTLQLPERSTYKNGPRTARLIQETKEFLSIEYRNQVRLAKLSHMVGVSPAYLSYTFSRAEGQSLHKYLTQLRLSQALLELPYTNDITALAIELGFSSHSHFTASFREAFGCTPSQFRGNLRKLGSRS